MRILRNLEFTLAAARRMTSVRRNGLSRWARWFPVLAVVVSSWFASRAATNEFELPTANRALYEPAGGAQFLVGTVGKTWESGGFGCVRTGGRQLHEGLDIRCLQRDAKGEPTDPIRAAADGDVAYINRRPSLSNYGIYVILRHRVDGMELYSLYAHLSKVAQGLAVGTKVRKGQVIATMGRTANTREGIGRDRAHLHFELNLVVHDRYAAWHARTLKGVRNDHGNFNGHNLLGLDPRRLFLEQQRLGSRFSVPDFIRSEPELCRVQVAATGFPWIKRYPQLVRPNPKTAREGVGGYELSLTFNGIPREVIPRAPSEMRRGPRFQILSVNRAEWTSRPCGNIVFPRGQMWVLLPKGNQVLDLMTTP